MIAITIKAAKHPKTIRFVLRVIRG